MRSQLDCQDPRLPGSGVFDIKTRAALPIRLDMMNYEVCYSFVFHQSSSLNLSPSQGKLWLSYPYTSSEIREFREGILRSH